MLKFEWDEAKALSNEAKHKVTFTEAATIFSDPLAYTFNDPDHSINEARMLTFGISSQGRLLVVVHVEHKRHIRIISARKATKHEREIYEQN